MNHGSSPLAGLGLIPVGTAAAVGALKLTSPAPPPHRGRSDSGYVTQRQSHNSNNMERNSSNNNRAPPKDTDVKLLNGDSHLDDQDDDVIIVKQMPSQASSQTSSSTTTTITVNSINTQSTLASSTSIGASPTSSSQEFRGGLRIKSRPKKNGLVANIASHNNIEAVEKGSLIPGPTIIKQDHFNRPQTTTTTASVNSESNTVNGTKTTFISTSKTTNLPSHLPLPSRVLPSQHQGVTPPANTSPRQQNQKRTPIGSTSSASMVMQPAPQSPTKQTSTQTETISLTPTKARPVTSTVALSTPPASLVSKEAKFVCQTPPLAGPVVPEFLTHSVPHSNNSNSSSSIRSTTTQAKQTSEAVEKPSNGTTTNATAYNKTSPTTSAVSVVASTMTPNKKVAAGDQTPPPPFTWEKYLELMPGVPAPKEAFMQSLQPLGNLFEIGMKLEARDIRNSPEWSLASVNQIWGDRIKIRFEGSDNMNDFFELVDSDNIRPCGSIPGEMLLPPLNYKSNISNYTKFVEKTLLKPEVKLAPKEAFKQKPKQPPKNLFEPGMKLEAIDRKHPTMIYPATVGEVRGDEIKVEFDFWKGSFDYTCKYYNRDIFPINWCRDTGHPMHPPKCWSALVNHEPIDKTSPAKGPHRTGPKSSQTTVTSTRNSLPPILNKSKNSVGRPRLSNGSPPKQLSPPKQQQAIMTKATSSPTKNTSPQTKNHSPPTKNPSPPSSTRIINTPAKQKLSSPPKPSVLKRGVAEKRALSPTPDCSSMDSLDDSYVDETETEDTDTDIDLGCRQSSYQCQRTVPYDEWKRLKEEGKLNIKPYAQIVNRNVDNDEVMNEKPSTAAAGSTTSQVVDGLINPEQRQHSFPSPSGSSRGEEVEEPPRKKVAFSNNNTSNLVETVSDVVNLIKSDESLSKYSSVFEANEIDGKAFVLLTTDVMVNHLNLKIGPVLKINKLIEQVRRGKH